MAGSLYVSQRENKRKLNFDHASGTEKKVYSMCNSACAQEQFTDNIITSISYCQLLRAAKSRFCSICLQLNARILTDFECSSCHCVCCVDCYDAHLRERIKNIMFVENYETLFINRNGNCYVKTSKQNSGSNSVTKMKSQKEINLQNLLYTLKCQLSSKTGLEFCLDRDLNGIFFLDKAMKVFFYYYPEYVSVHIASEIIELDLTLYVLIGEDSNKHCEIFGACFIFNDDSESLSWICKMIKTHYPNWNEIKLLFLDHRIKDTMFKINFPQASVLFSRFHSLLSFKTGISSLDIRKSDAKRAIKLFQSLLYVTTESNYAVVHTKFLFCDLVADYFQEKWNSSKNTWALGLKFKSKTFLCPMDKFLKQIDKKLRLLNRLKCLQMAVEHIFTVISAFRREHYRSISSLAQYSTFPVSNVDEQNIGLFTASAMKLISRHLDLANHIKIHPSNDFGIYNYVDSETVTVSNNFCSCAFYQSVCLPCCHIFAVRKKLLLPQLTTNLCSSRWYIHRYKMFFLFFHEPYLEHFTTVADKMQIIENFELCLQIAALLLPLISDSSNIFSKECYGVLTNLLKAWNYGIQLQMESLKVHSIENLNYHIHDLENLHITSTNNFSPEELSCDLLDDAFLECITNLEMYPEICN